jgi:hypothetical protein
MGAGTSRIRLLVGIGVALVATAAVVALVRSRERNDEPGVYVHAGPRTTWITEPLRPDGTVDYVAFVSAERSRGVTKDNDLAPILSLCLEKPLRGVPPASDRAPPPAPVVSWFSWTLDHHLDAEVEDSEELDWLSGRVDGPHAVEIRQWLTAIGPGLDLIQREAKTRDHWFAPPEFGDTVCAVLTSAVRVVAPCFCMRAAGRNADSDLAGAIEDLSTAYNLIGRWRGEDGLVGLLAVFALERASAFTIAAVAEKNHAWKSVDFRRVDASIPRAPRDEQFAEMLPWERLWTLDSSFHWRVDDLPARKMDRFLERINDGIDTRTPWLVAPLDWERSIDALRERGDRMKSSPKHWTLRWDFWRERTKPVLPADDPEAAGELLDELTLPTWRLALETSVEATVETDAARMRFALACFENERGRLPADLAELTAACFDSPPRDRLYREPLGWTVGLHGTIDVTSRGAPLADRLKAQHAKPR